MDDCGTTKNKIKRRKKLEIPTIRWSWVEHDWSFLPRPTSIYWNKSDAMANRHIEATLVRAMRFSCKVFRGVSEISGAEFRSVMRGKGVPLHIVKATQAWMCMNTFFRLDGTLPLILAEIVLNTLQWHKFPEVLEPTDDEFSNAVCVWRNLEQDFHDDQLNLCDYYAGFHDGMGL